MKIRCVGKAKKCPKRCVTEKHSQYIALKIKRKDLGKIPKHLVADKRVFRKGEDEWL
jgi:hypothetical protein